MSPAHASLSIIAIVIAGTIAFALVAVRRIGSDPHQYIVGGRSLGSILLWVLMGGEIYTTFTFLGAAGWAYGRGAEAYYILGYGVAAYVIGYLYLPKLWRYASERRLMTLGDFFTARYSSKSLGALVGLVAGGIEVLNCLVYLTGLQIVLTIAGFGHINAIQAAVSAFVVITIFVFTAGLRGMAWASIIKDSLTIGCAFTVGLLLPIVFFGSPQAVLDRVISASPGTFVLGGWTADHGKIWFLSTMILTSLGFFSSAAAAAATYAAKSEQTVRRNAIFLPLYSLMLIPLFFAGYTARLLVPGLSGPAADSAYLHVLQTHFSPILLGVICSAAALCALLPSAARLLAGASNLTKNVLADLFNVARSGRALTWSTRAAVVALAGASLLLWLFVKASLVDLLLFAYSGFTQMLPGILLGLYWKRANAFAVAAGLTAGEITAYALTISAPALWGLNPGFIALLLNVATTVALSLVRLPAHREQRAYDVG